MSSRRGRNSDEGRGFRKMREIGQEKENEDLLMRVETSVWEREKANSQQNGEGGSQAAKGEGRVWEVEGRTSTHRLGYST